MGDFLMLNRNNYYYKGYDITSNSRREKKEMEFLNPYGYNFDANMRRKNADLVYKTNQDNIHPYQKSSKKC